MNVTFWGTRGSLPCSGPDTQIYGGNTPCVSVSVGEELLILDAGSGIRRLGINLKGAYSTFHLLLSHLHMDHIQGMGFFLPLYDPKAEVHIYGPAGHSAPLIDRLSRYLSPPLFPIRIRELPCRLFVHEVPPRPFNIGSFRIVAQRVIHPGVTIGYRIQHGQSILAYLPDHEPMLGANGRMKDLRWLSGHDLAHQAGLLIHDAQFTDEEYPRFVGWGHSSLSQTLEFARLTEVRQLALFHHDPGRDDLQMEVLFQQTLAQQVLPFDARIPKEGEILVI
ncbi:MAG: MBL fold metallo-hydrolase [Haliscomenobacter sp.]|nr:MBL fold metallo-hydrolase [Haliscomenobacter sp.]MBK8879478.1 MBL fold metallo-hydrolase [Haliscomenobacter sp.]